MSSVDNRVVQMEFDNKRFENNVATTMSTLERLKKALHFGSETDDLEKLQKAGDSFNLNRMASALDSISSKFTTLGQIGFKAMEKIATAAVNAGEKMIKALTVDQVSTGMSKYEQETNSVQAIYAAVKRKGKSLDDVYSSLDKLAEYSDETSYSYTQMVDGAAKFIANGIDMDQAVSSMMGIANAAAQSGVSIQDASYAFKNFSDAMSAGHFMIKDWQSIQNIHMDTELFKNEVIASAKALGKLDKAGHIIDQTTGKVRDDVLTIENFRENLRYGFFDTDVMLDVLSKYSNFDWDRIKSGDFQTMGDEAAAMAQQAKTFTDVFDAVKDAASTGWKESFRYIFGNLEEAIDFFTPMANNIIEVVQEFDEARNTLLSGWKDAGGRDSMIGALKTIWDTFIMVKDQIKLAGSFVWGKNSPFGELINGNILADVTKGFQNAAVAFKEWLGGVDTSGGGSRLLKITNIFRGLGSVIELVRQSFGGVGTFVKNIFGQLVPTFDAVLSFFSSIGMSVNRALNAIKESGVITRVANGLANAFKPITDRLPGLVKGAQQLFQNTILFIKTNPKIKSFTKAAKTMFSAFINFLPKAVEGVIQFGKSIWETIQSSDEWKWLTAKFNQYIKPLGTKFVEFGTLLATVTKGFFNIDTSGEKGLWNKLKKRFGVFKHLRPWLKEQWDALKQQFPILQNVEDWWNSSALVASVKNWASTIGSAIDQFMSADTSGETSLVGKLKKRIEAFTGTLGPFLQEHFDALKEKFPIIQQIQDFFASLFPKKEMDGGEEGAEKGITVGDTIKRLFEKLKEAASHISGGTVAKVLLAIWGIAKVIKAVKNIKNTFNVFGNLSGVMESASGVLDTLKEKLGGGLKAKIKSLIKQVLPVAASIWLLADALKKIGDMEWEDVGKGLTGLAGLFVEQGAFMILMNHLGKLGKRMKSPLQMGTLLGIGVSIKLLVDSMKSIAELEWEGIGKGLTGLAGLFAEEGAFMILMNRLGKVKKSQNPLSFGQLLGMAINIKILAGALKSIGEMEWEGIAKGLVGMGGLFAEEGAFMILVNRLGSLQQGQVNQMGLGAQIGMAMQIQALSDSMQRVAKLSWEEIGKGLTGMAGLFAEQGVFTLLMGHIGTIDKNPLNFTNMLSTSSSIMMLADSLKKIGEMEWEGIGKGLAGMAGLFVEGGVFSAIMGHVAGLGIASGIGFFAIGKVISMFADSMVKTKDISPDQMFSFGEAIGILAAAMIPLSTVVQTLGALGIGGALKGSIGLIAIFAALSAGIALMGSAVSSQISGFGSAMAELGGAMGTFQDLTADVDGEGVKAKLGVAKEMANAGTEIGTKNYGNIDGFANMVTRLGGGIRLFSMMTTGVDTASKTQLITDIVKMAGDLSGISKVEDVSTTIANIGAAIKLYGENVNGVQLDNVPDTTKIAEIFKAIHDSAASSLGTDMLSDVSGYAGEGSTDSLTQFALGLTNITSAFSSFATSIEGISLENVQGAVEKLESLAELTTKLQTSKQTIIDFGAFTVTVTNQATSLGQFAMDVVTLGSALNDFATNIGGVNMMQLWMAVGVLDAISAINDHLPDEGGIQQWITGTRSLTKFSSQIRMLGTNLGHFNESVTADGFNMESVKAGIGVIGELAEANQKLPETGGLRQWFTGTQDLAAFGKGLGALGNGMKEFSTEFGNTQIGQNILDAMDPLNQLIDMQNKLVGMTGFGDTLLGFSSTLGNVATNFKTMNTTMNGITEFADLAPLESLIDFAATLDSKLNMRKTTTQIHDFMVDVQEMIKDIKWIGDHPGDFSINADKANEIASTIGGILHTLGTSIGGQLDTSVSEGIGQNGAAEGAAGTLAGNAANRIRGYYGQFSAAGGYLASGLANGLRSGTSQVIGAINNMSDAMVSALRSKLRINSPSKVFAALGESIPEGLGLGVRRESGNTAKLSERLGQGMIDAFKNKLGIHSPSSVMEDAGKDYIRGIDLGITKKKKSFLGKIADIAKESKEAFDKNIEDTDYKLAKATLMPKDGSMTEEEFRKYYESLAKNGERALLGLKDATNATVSTNKTEDKKDEKKSGGGGGSKSDASSEAASHLGAIDYSTDIAIIVTRLTSITDQFATLLEDLEGYIQYNYNGGLTSLGYALTSLLEDSKLTLGSGSSATLTPVMDDLSKAAAQSYDMMSMSTPKLAAQASALAENMAYTESLNTIIAELQAMNERIEDMFDIVGNLQIVLDTGELVGGTVSGYDSEIGRRTSYADRGIAT